MDRYQSSIFKQVVTQQSPPITVVPGPKPVAMVPNDSKNNSNSFSSLFKDIMKSGSSSSTNIPPVAPNIFVTTKSQPNLTKLESNSAESIFSRNNSKTTPPLLNQQHQQQTVPIPITAPPLDIDSGTTGGSGGLSRSLTSLPPFSISNSQVYANEEESEFPPNYISSNTTTTHSSNISNSTSNNIQKAPPTPTDHLKTHKRFLSTSSIGSSGNSASLNEKDTSPKISLLKSKQILDNTFKKVITSVKNLSPQVDSILKNIDSLNFSNNSTPNYNSPPNTINHCNNTVTTNNDGLLPTVPLDNSFDSGSSSPRSLSPVNSVTNSENSPKKQITPQVQEQQPLDFYSYYGYNNDDEESLGRSNELNRSDLEVSPKRVKDVDEVDETLKWNSNGKGVITHRVTLNLPFKSKMFEQLSTQQSRFERSLFSIPIEEENLYPSVEVFLDGLSSPSSTSSDDNSNEDEEQRITRQCKAIKEDIHLQRFKTLPPLPGQTLKYDIKAQRFKPLPPLPPQPLSISTGRSMNNNNSTISNSSSPNQYGKLSSILQLLSFSMPNSNQQTMESSHSNDSDSNQKNSGVNQYNEEDYRHKENLNQYLNEYGDKIKIFQHINWHLEQNNVNIEIVKLLGSHYGFPEHTRAHSWMILNEYIPVSSHNRASALLQKRSQYRELIKKYYKDEQQNQLFSHVFKLLNNTIMNSQQDDEVNKVQELIQQVHLDVIRTRPDGFCELFELKEIEKMMERILVIWSLENQDVSYFQGLNDLLCPFILVFLDSELLQCFNEQAQQPSYPMIQEHAHAFVDNDDLLSSSGQPMQRDEFKLQNRLGDGKIISDLIECGKLESLAKVEADVYWSISSLLSTVKHYARDTGSGLPAERLMKKLELLVRVSNEELYKHFQSQGLDFSHFAFRWMVCFLTREFDMQTGIELWDRYMCDKSNEGFSLLHICFCAALLDLWSNDLLQKDFMELVQFLQKPPSLEYSSSHLDLIFRNALYKKQTYRNFLIAFE
ncbi:RabGAP/TBC domain-containing protein [Tieghemostelium lacteum]|uniref:RabGAP/TBC domain-containing protein n=1 Tax=Tieghemostelium lacteum TaxID=361077 RepID=A0A152A7P3_TIELA|nr:RabGAP/TBC domain-containing protein [Tieghemostelium lacteum]|eukprot:KYR02141.1 RabGAP/TBC domain-containing protein [Tieghemostelium lacteum]